VGVFPPPQPITPFPFFVRHSGELLCGSPHEIPDVSLPRCRAEGPYGPSPFRPKAVLPRFYILDEIPAALCHFITFAGQMMSLDILRRGFIVVFYAGRAASVKRIRAFTTHRLSRRNSVCLARVNAPSSSLFSAAREAQPCLFYCLLYCRAR